MGSPVAGSVPSISRTGTPLSDPNTLNVGPGLLTTKGTGITKRITTIARAARMAVRIRQLMIGVRFVGVCSKGRIWSTDEDMRVSLTVSLCPTQRAVARPPGPARSALSVFAGICQLSCTSAR